MNDSNQTSRQCPRCGGVLSSDAPENLCPRCLAALPLGAETVLSDEDAQAAAAPLSPEELAPHFPQLEILECLGRGGMGVVYKARQKSLNRGVALKLLAPERAGDANFAERFAKEAQALAALNHPHIVAVYDFGQAGGFYFLLMEFVDGVNLRQAMQAGRFTPEQALAIVPPVCEALQCAHEHGIVHRDIKPENLLLDKDGRVKIADFGVAKMLGENSSVGVAETQPAGTPQYMAPEQKEHRRTDHRADIYSLGVVLYEMLTGELPGAEFQQPSRKVQIDVRIDEIVLRALEKAPELRFQTAGEMRTQVETITHGGPRAEAGSAIPMRLEKPRTTLSNLAFGLAWASGIFAAITWCLMPLPPMFLVWSILIAALAALAMGIKTRRLPRGKWALWFGLVQCCVWFFVAIFFSVGEANRQRAAESEPGVGPEIERVVIRKDEAVVESRGSTDAGMIITFGPMTNRWTPSGVYLSAMFDVTQERGWFERGFHWVVKGRPNIHVLHRLDGPPGPMLGKIAFHPGTPAREADGSYVIGEFRPENHAPLPIAVSLVRDGQETVSPAQAGNEKATVASANRAPLDDSPRQVVAEFLRRMKAESEEKIDIQQVWDLTTRSSSASWGSDMRNMVREDLIHPLHQLGNDEQTLVLSAPFKYQDRESIFTALLLKRDGRWLIDRHDGFRSPAEVVSLMEGFMLNAGVKFDVQAAELTGVWHFPCASTLTLYPDGKGVRVYEGPSGVTEKSERFRWDASGSTLRTHWPDHTDTETIAWVTDDAFRIQNAAGAQSYYGNREEAIAPGSPHEFVVFDPRLEKKEASYFGIDAGRRRNNYNDDLTAKFGVSEAHQTDATLIAWMKKHRIDAVGRVVLADGKVTQLGLRTFELLTIPAAADAWEKATPSQIAEKVEERLSEWGFISVVNDLLTDGQVPATFYFQTREGSQGLLQILGPAEKNGVKIRYKMTKEPEEASADARPADPQR